MQPQAHVVRDAQRVLPALSPMISPTNASRRDQRREFERVALPVAPALFRTARRLSGPDDAGDLVQETYLRAYRTFGGFEPGTSAKAWLFTILYSIVSNAWRRNRRAPRELSLDDVEERFERALASREESVEVQMVRQLGSSPEIEAALLGLPDTYKAAVLLVDVEELTYEEAASVLECPVGTVRSRLSRARKLLYAALHDYALRTGVVRTD